MLLAPVPFDGHPSLILDWLEFSVLCSEYRIASIADLTREWDKRRNTEQSDFEESNSTEDVFLDQIQTALRDRMRILTESYPFTLSDTGESLELVEDLTQDQYAYLLCLLFSHDREGEVLSGEYLPDLTYHVRDLFQICATLAAAGISRGSAISFGFPRPDRSAFLNKLKEVYAAFGEGKVVDQVPLGAPPEVKDDDIDVIAWGTRQDGGPGKFYLLGQVASGANWLSKSVRGAVELFHKTWFSNPWPASTPTPAMFVPFCVYPTSQGESRNERLLFLTNKFGYFYYRYMVAPLVKEGISLAEKKTEGVIIERVDEFKNVIAWVDEQLLQIRAQAGWAH